MRLSMTAPFAERLATARYLITSGKVSRSIWPRHRLLAALLELVLFDGDEHRLGSLTALGPAG